MQGERLDWNAIAGVLVERLAPLPAEPVMLLAMESEFEALVSPLRRAISGAGGVDLALVECTAEPFPAGVSESEAASLFPRIRAALREMFRGAAVTVILPGVDARQPAYAALQDLLREGHGRTVHFHWHGAYDLEGRPIPIDARVDRCYERALLETDYGRLAEHERRLEEAMRAGEVRVRGEEGTDLRFAIGDRPVTRQDGDASAGRAASARNLVDREVELPAGGVRVAPMEESVEGVLVFPRSHWSGEPVENARFRFECGRAVAVEADRGQEALERELERAGEAGRAFREFALGLNPRLAIPESDPWIPYYGYGAGVVRLSLGDNEELGGAVTGDWVRWNFSPALTVEIGGRRWVENGRLVSV